MPATFRMDLPILAILTQDDGHKITVTIPRNAVVTIRNGTGDGEKLITVQWEEQRLMVFSQDVWERGTFIDNSLLPLSSETVPSE